MHLDTQSKNIIYQKYQFVNLKDKFSFPRTLPNAIAF
ncbi:hypothetical protein SAMN04489723_1299 [Algoriphagus aquimarinus]|uniref:Uncharacterized protein n=1 Tax=Algoriphagus aquimarinus TaxID=237018 RepID=A0A1I1CCS3_9BACT|nr:hypothetical protein SAMN04489723_1299 [Algoriphagus aquimarinus]